MDIDQEIAAHESALKSDVEYLQSTVTLLDIIRRTSLKLAELHEKKGNEWSSIKYQVIAMAMANIKSTFQRLVG